MSELIKDLKYFWSRKLFAVGLVLTMVLSYATLLLNPTVGIDDTSFKLYYIDGVSPAMGRWCLYMIHKIFPLDYNPYFVETIGLLFFCLSVSLWCVVFYRLFGQRIPMVVYTAFACVMISSPILSEVVVWYVQDGIYLGYGVTALTVLACLSALREQENIPENIPKNIPKNFREKFWKKFWKFFRKFFPVKGILLSAVLLAVALGFYEAFMIVFLMAMVMCFMITRLLRDEKSKKNPKENPMRWFGVILAVCALGMVFRSLIINAITAVFHLEDQALVLESRNFGDIVDLALGWFDGSRQFSDFVMVLKEFFVKYTIHGIVYLPVLILVLAELVLIVWGIWNALRHKDGWIALAVLAILLLPWVMPVLEGTATYYRSSEYVPLLTAFSVMLVGYELYRCERSVKVRGIGLFLAFLLLYRQGYEMNKWLLVDAMKYEDDKRTLDALALELMAEYDVDKPICVIGNRETPTSLLEDVYCPEWSKKYALVSFLVKAVDEEIFEKYNTSDGYAVAETPQLSFINWANKAYYGFDRELIQFWKMHGFTFVEDGDLSHYKSAKKLMQDAPVWPQKGSIVELEDYIIVNFGNF